MTRPAAWLINRAVLSGTAKRSAYGRSCASAEATPVCSVIGANTTPRDTSRVTTRSVNGRDALGISALPGSVANTDWYALSGHGSGTYPYRIGWPYAKRNSRTERDEPVS